MPELTIIPSGISLTVPYGITVLEALGATPGSPSIYAPCGGQGRCGQCRIRILHGPVSDPTPEDMQASRKDPMFPRLACRTRILGDVRLELPPQLMTTKAVVDGAQDRVPGGPVGLAVDLGTTTIAAYLVDLASGIVISAAAGPNPQAARGADVITRLAWALADPAHPSQLAGTAAAAIQALAVQALEQAGTGPDHIAQVVIAGNTAMQHLFLGWDVGSLARAPYVPSTLESADLTANRIGLPFPNARVYVMPTIGGFVGGDHVALLLSSDPPERPTLLIDVGTNTEISLWSPDRLVSCSCASGPAFEGGMISRGMPAQDGAIDHVWLEHGQICRSVIGSGSARGFCGSGLVDFAFALRSLGRLDRSGRLSGEEGIDGVPITQADVRQLQLAKAAIAAGIACLLTESSLTAEDIETVGLAGAFGAALDPRSAIGIGMFPPFPLDRFRSLGNAAGRGAVLALDPNRRERATELARTAQHLDLVGVSGFQSSFIRHLRLDRWTADQ